MTNRRENEIYDELLLKQSTETDRIFRVILPMQWMISVLLAFYGGPFTWSGVEPALHPHVMTAVILGGLLTVAPFIAIRGKQGAFESRMMISLSQLSFSALFIHLTNGRIESHFHVFVSLAFLSFYRDFRVILAGALLTSIDHFVRGALWPESVYGVIFPTYTRSIEHGAWVVFEVIVLTRSIKTSLSEMRTIASKQAELENSLALVESEVHRRTKKLLESNELINLQKQKLETSSKMSALGEISGGIAHEIKNPLAVIIGASEQAEKKILSNSWDPNDLKKQVGLIRRNAQRMSKIIDSLRRFSRNAAADPLDPVSASSIINDVLELLGDFAKSDDIRMESSLLFDFDFECRPSEIGQILLNLALNSRDAIATKENRWITIGAYRLADRVRFSVTDCGDGIEESIVEKLSQPFFSTKPKDKGTGLGLSISKKLAVDHGGLLYYDRTSKNTRFNLDLPLKKGEVITSTDEIDPAHAGECA